jgi:uncharacterized protein (DUF58 family)
VMPRSHAVALLSALVAAALLYALMQGGVLAWHLLGFVLAWALVSGVSLVSPLGRVRVNRSFSPGPYYADEPLTVTLTVHTPFFWPWPWLAIVDPIPAALAPKPARFVVRVWTTKPIRLDYQIPRLARGAFEFPRVEVASGDWFGLTQRTVAVKTASTLVVWPKPLTPNLLASRQTARSPQWVAAGVPDPLLRGVRPYQPGDRLRDIHWKASAHSGRIQVKEWERRGESEMTVVLDSASHFTPQQWEWALKAAASLVVQARREHRAIWFNTLDRLPSPDVRPADPADYAGWMDWLARLDYLSAPPAPDVAPWPIPLYAILGSRCRHRWPKETVVWRAAEAEKEARV